MSSHENPPYGRFSTFTFTSLPTTPCWFFRFSSVTVRPPMRSASAHSAVSSLFAGSTSNYFELLAPNKLETALSAEADTMGGLTVSDDNVTDQHGDVGDT